MIINKINNSYYFFVLLFFMFLFSCSEGQETNKSNLKYLDKENPLKSFKRYTPITLNSLNDSLEYIDAFASQKIILDSFSEFIGDFDFPEIDSSLSVKDKVSIIEEFNLEMLEHSLTKYYFERGVRGSDTTFFFRKAHMDFSYFVGKRVQELLDSMERKYDSYYIRPGYGSDKPDEIKKVKIGYCEELFELVIFVEPAMRVKKSNISKIPDYFEPWLKLFKEQRVSYLEVIYKKHIVYPNEYEGYKSYD